MTLDQLRLFLESLQGNYNRGISSKILHFTLDSVRPWNKRARKLSTKRKGDAREALFCPAKARRYDNSNTRAQLIGMSRERGT